jgi:glycosyltransferase involved in cell wall biosynthesis
MKAHIATPLVSVIVPNYNHAEFLEVRLRSIVGQSFQDFELIILDDASQDDSLLVIQRTLKDQPFRLFCNEVNSGDPCSQWIKGLREARGKYIWIAESDDTCLHVFLERMVAELEKGVVLAYCRTASIDSHGFPMGTNPFWPDTFDSERWQSSFTLGSLKLCRTFMAQGNVIANASSVVFRKPLDSFLRKMKSLTNKKRHVGDWLFWSHYLMQSRGCIRFESDELSLFRCHDKTTRTIANSTIGTNQEAEIRRFAEYSFAIASILRITHRWPILQWLRLSSKGCWDWILSEYLFRCRPNPREKLFLRIVSGPLRWGIYVRLLTSRALRREYFSQHAYVLKLAPPSQASGS